MKRLQENYLEYYLMRFSSYAGFILADSFVMLEEAEVTRLFDLIAVLLLLPLFVLLVFIIDILVRIKLGSPVLIQQERSGLSSNILLNKEIVKACRANGIYTNIFMVLTKIPFKLLELIRKPAI